MSQHQIDLDVLIGPDVEVLIGDDAFMLPADIPAPKMLRLLALYEKSDDGDGSIEDMRAIVEEVLGIFQIRQPELEELPIGFGGILVLLEKLMNLYSVADEEDAPPARPTQARSRPSSNGSSRSRKPAAGARKSGARSVGAS